MRVCPYFNIAGTNDVTMDVAQAARRPSELVTHADIISLTEGAYGITSAADLAIPSLSRGL